MACDDRQSRWLTPVKRFSWMCGRSMSTSSSICRVRSNRLCCAKDLAGTARMLLARAPENQSSIA